MSSPFAAVADTFAACVALWLILFAMKVLVVKLHLVHPRPKFAWCKKQSWGGGEEETSKHMATATSESLVKTTTATKACQQQHPINSNTTNTDSSSSSSSSSSRSSSNGCSSSNYGEHDTSRQRANINEQFNGKKPTNPPTLRYNPGLHRLIETPAPAQHDSRPTNMLRISLTNHYSVNDR